MYHEDHFTLSQPSKFVRGKGRKDREDNAEK